MGWIALFIVQIVLVAVGRLRMHQRIGNLLIFWAVAMLCIAPVTLVLATRRLGTQMPVIEFVGDVGQLVVFGFLVFRAIMLRRTRPDSHKRLMILATATVMLPAIARIPWKISLTEFALLYFAPAAMLVALDLYSLRRVHGATLLGVGAMLSLFVGTLLIAETQAAAAVVHWIQTA